MAPVRIGSKHQNQPKQQPLLNGDAKGRHVADDDFETLAKEWDPTSQGCLVLLNQWASRMRQDDVSVASVACLPNWACKPTHINPLCCVDPVIRCSARPSCRLRRLRSWCVRWCATAGQ